jgi:hypothetical protein
MATGWIVFVRCTFAKAAVRDGVTSLIASALCFTANAASVDEPLKLAGSQLEPVSWSENSNHARAR